MSIDLSKMSKLGFGLMRLPENDGVIDTEHVSRMVDAYMKKGFNYFDTAYVYHGGKSESIAKEVLTKRYPRDSFMLATKLPIWKIEKPEDRDIVFNEQLERAGVDYFDFYLLHSVEDGSNYENYVKYDCFNWGKQKKEEGKIKHFGFSFHGTPQLLLEVLNTYPEVEFVQIQLNYADWDNPLVQSGKLYEILHSRNIPIIVMEPVKGGTLAQPGAEIEDMFRTACPARSVSSWAFRFVASLEGIMTILSGMSNEEQMNDNLDTFTDFVPLSESEKDVLKKAVEKMFSVPFVACTACRYCCDDCPQSINIPEVIKALNVTRRSEKEVGRAKSFYAKVTKDSGRAGDCIACGQCEGVCPQHLPIIELMQEAASKFDEEK